MRTLRKETWRAWRFSRQCVRCQSLGALLCGNLDLSRSVPSRDSLAGAFEKFPETALQSDPISHFDNPDFEFDFDESNV